MSRVIATVTLQLVYDPNLDTDQDIKSRLEGEINTMMSHGHLEGCEHGAQITSHDVTVQVTRMKDEPEHNHFGEIFLPDTCPACKALKGS